MADHLRELAMSLLAGKRFRVALRRIGDGNRRDSAGVNDPLHTVARSSLKKTARALYVALVNLGRVPGPQTIIRGNVKNLPNTLHGAIDGTCIAQVAIDSLDRRTSERLKVTAGPDQNPNR